MRTEYLSIDESTEIAKKILSSVFRLKDKASPEYVLLNLKGCTTTETLKLEHHRISTFGLLRNKKDVEIKFWMDQLAFKFGLISLNNRGFLDFTERGKTFLKKSQKLQFEEYRTRNSKQKPISPQKKILKQTYAGDEIIKIRYTREPSGYKLPQESSGYRMRLRKPAKNKL